MNVLVTGGAGYIGSHAVKALVEAGHRVTVVDSLERGHRQAVHESATLEALDLRQTGDLATILERDGIECVMHFAALAYVGESVDHPLRYYDNNAAGSLSLLRAMDAAGVRRMVFSSTCATYGIPEQMPIVEIMPQQPINPYGWSKLFVERMLADYAAAEPAFGFTALRYFNVAGCAADGTCIRDYIHVEDLVEAHILAMNALRDGDARFYNLGIGRGYSVREMIEAAKAVTGVDFKVEIGPRRPGDPPELYANADRIREDLGFSPRYTDIRRIIETAWNWFKAHPKGYEKA